MDSKVRGLNPDGGKIFYISVHPTSCKMYTRPFRETEGPEIGAEHTASSAEVEKGLELYLRFPSPSAYACREATIIITLTYWLYFRHGDKYLQILQSRFPVRNVLTIAMADKIYQIASVFKQCRAAGTWDWIVAPSKTMRR